MLPRRLQIACSGTLAGRERARLHTIYGAATGRHARSRGNGQRTTWPVASTRAGS